MHSMNSIDSGINRIDNEAFWRREQANARRDLRRAFARRRYSTLFDSLHPETAQFRFELIGAAELADIQALELVDHLARRALLLELAQELIFAGRKVDSIKHALQIAHVARHRAGFVLEIFHGLCSFHADRRRIRRTRKVCVSTRWSTGLTCHRHELLRAAPSRSPARHAARLPSR